MNKWLSFSLTAAGLIICFALGGYGIYEAVHQSTPGIQFIQYPRLRQP